MSVEHRIREAIRKATRDISMVVEDEQQTHGAGAASIIQACCIVSFINVVGIMIGGYYDIPLAYGALISLNAFLCWRTGSFLTRRWS